MKTAEEILTQYEDINEMHFHEVDRTWILEAMKEYAQEVAHEALKNASESAVCVKYDGCIEESYRNHYVGSVYIEVDKQTILNESNIPSI